MNKADDYRTVIIAELQGIEDVEFLRMLHTMIHYYNQRNGGQTNGKQ